MAWAGLLGAAENVRINAPALEEGGSATLAELEELLREGRTRAESLGLL